MSEYKRPRLLRADEIELRVGRYIDGKGCSLLLYKTARVDMDILDETYGPENWSNDYKEIKGNLYCGICVNDVWKWDCGTESNTEAEKGEASDAFKRAGFRFGIGRELYSAPFVWVPEALFQTKATNGKKAPKDGFCVADIKYNASRKICALSIKNTSSEKIVFEFGKPTVAGFAGIKKPVCADCGKIVHDEYIAEGTMKAYGRVLCKECGMKLKRAKNESKADKAE